MTTTAAPILRWTPTQVKATIAKYPDPTDLFNHLYAYLRKHGDDPTLTPGQQLILLKNAEMVEKEWAIQRIEAGLSLGDTSK